MSQITTGQFNKESHVWRKCRIQISPKSTGGGRGSFKRLPVSRVPGGSLKWHLFLSQYEKFTDLLCVAAKNGCDDQLESQFRNIKRWFNDNYHKTSWRLISYFAGLPTVGIEHRRNLASAGNGYRKLDPLLSVFARRTLQEIINDDKGELIGVISRISEAIYSCDRAAK